MSGDVETAFKALKLGITYREAAFYGGVDANVLYRYAKKQGFGSRKRGRPFKNSSKSQMASNMIAQGATFAEASKASGLPTGSIHAACKRRGIKSVRAWK